MFGRKITMTEAQAREVYNRAMLVYKNPDSTRKARGSASADLNSAIYKTWRDGEGCGLRVNMAMLAGRMAYKIE